MDGIQPIKSIKLDENKTFFNLNNQECLDLYPRIIINAETLLNVGEVCAEKQHFGIALSISILASEEWIKASLLYLKGLDVQVFKIKELGNVFRNNHKHRHETAALFDFIKIAESFIEVQKLEKEKKTKISWLNNTLHFLKQANIVLNSVKTSMENADWWQKADDYKNKGIYVGFEGIPLLPQNITKADYEQGRKCILEVVRILKSMIQYFNEGTEAELKELAVTLNDAVKLYQEKHKTIKIPSLG